MANIPKEEVWKAINNAPPGMTSQEVLDGLVAQGHYLEGYTPGQPPALPLPVGSNSTGEFSGNAGIEEAGIPPGIGLGGPGRSLALASMGLGQGKEINAILSGAAIPQTVEAGVGLAKGGYRLASGLANGEGFFNSLRNAFTGTPLTDTKLSPEQLREQAGQLMANRASKIEQAVGGFENDVANGTGVQSLIQANSKAARQVASDAFEALKASAPNTQLRPDNLLKEIYNQSLDISQLPPVMQKGPLATLIKSSQNALTEGEEANTSLKQLMALRGELSQLAAKNTGIQGLAGQTTNTGRQAYSLIDALDKDIQAGSKLPGAEDFAAEYKAARTGWKQFKDTFANDHVEKIMNANPSDVGNLGFKSPEVLQALQNAGGEDALALLKKSVAKDLVTKVSGTAVPQTALERVIAAKPDEFQALFSPSELQTVRDFAGARQYLTNIPGDVPTSSEAVSKLGTLMQSYGNKAAQSAGLGAAFTAGGMLLKSLKSEKK